LFSAQHGGGLVPHEGLVRGADGVVLLVTRLGLLPTEVKQDTLATEVQDLQWFNKTMVLDFTQNIQIRFTSVYNAD